MIRIAGLVAVAFAGLLLLPSAPAEGRGRVRPRKLRPRQIRRVLSALKPQLVACARKHGFHGDLRAQMWVRGSTGRITKLRIYGQPLQAAERRCVRRVLLRARFPRFRQATHRFVFNFRIPKPASARRSGTGAWLTAADVQRVMRAAYPSMRRCVPSRRKVYALLHITVRGATGRVSRVRAAVSNMRGAVRRCVQRAAKAARFPRFRGAKQTLKYTFSVIRR